MHSNRLVHEKSPYLLQHAHNPVDWFAWGEEAFEKARQEDKPIFLSVGYSTCHWCHVMERESFENKETAAVVNRYFVPVKVDREERPDVDRIYMAFVQATTQRGGWPMSVFLTPDLKPFYGGTYFPPESRYGMPGFKALLEFLAIKWKEDREKIQGVGIQTVNQLESMLGASSEGGALDQGAIDKLYFYFQRTFDTKLGGFGGRPKFPRPAVFDFLLRYHKLTGAADALDMVTQTLTEMAKGGMNDQLGGGFHRYSVDERWFVPHFEKMLYDQAQLAVSHLEAYQLTGDEFHAGIARDILEYVRRDMTHPEGGFYSAEDADSVIDPAKPHDKGEGAFYVWSHAELSALLTAEELEEACRVYGIENNGNVEEDPHHEFTGKNILYVARSPRNIDALESAQKKMFEYRAKTKVRPHLDDKVLTAWNGLMISAFAKGAQVLNQPEYLETARRATHFILRHLYRPEDARLLRRYRDGDAAIEGFLDDYAGFTIALLDLYTASFDAYYYELAVQLADKMVELFEDPEQGGFFSTREGDASLVLRLKEDYDGAEPSGNTLAMEALHRLGHEAADRALRHFGPKLASQGVTAPRMIAAGMLPSKQIVLAGEREDPAMEALLAQVRRRFLPGTAVFLLDAKSRAALERKGPPWQSATAATDTRGRSVLRGVTEERKGPPWQSATAASDTRGTGEKHASSLSAMHPMDGKPTAYVCENFTCQLPVTDPAKLAELLR